MRLSFHGTRHKSVKKWGILCNFKKWLFSWVFGFFHPNFLTFVNFIHGLVVKMWWFMRQLRTFFCQLFHSLQNIIVWFWEKIYEFLLLNLVTLWEQKIEITQYPPLFWRRGQKNLLPFQLHEVYHTFQKLLSDHSYQNTPHLGKIYLTPTCGLFLGEFTPPTLLHLK